jgi:hypothetical protein
MQWPGPYQKIRDSLEHNSGTGHTFSLAYLCLRRPLAKHKYRGKCKPAENHGEHSPHRYRVFIHHRSRIPKNAGGPLELAWQDTANYTRNQPVGLPDEICLNHAAND